MHFGTACLSDSCPKIPAYYAFSRSKISSFDPKIIENWLENEKILHFVVVYELEFKDFAAELIEVLRRFQRNFTIADPIFPENSANFVEILSNSNENEKVEILGRKFTKFADSDEFSFLFIGQNGPLLTNFMLNFPSRKFFRLDPMKNSISINLEIFDAKTVKISKISIE